MLEKSVTDQFPKQWEFDTDMKTITANQSRSDEHYNLIYGRVDYQRQKYDDAQIKWTEMIREFAQKDTLSQNEKRDLLKCYSNILSPKLSLSDEEVEGICSQFNQLLPVNSESKFDEEILSLHAEGRMRKPVETLPGKEYRFNQRNGFGGGWVFRTESNLDTLRKRQISIP